MGAHREGEINGIGSPMTRYKSPGNESAYNYYSGFLKGVRASMSLSRNKIIILSALQAKTILAKPEGLAQHHNQLWKNTFYASYRNRKPPSRPGPSTPARTVTGFKGTR